MMGASSAKLTACGFCKSDKEAAVYSFENMEFAGQKGNHYVVVEFLGIKGQQQWEEALRTLKALPGVTSKSVIAAYLQKTVSFVYEKENRFDDLVHAFKEKFPELELRRLFEK